MFNPKPFKYGKKSMSNLITCHTDLQLIFNEVIKYRDCAILCGQRGEIEQNKLFKDGKSKLKYPDSSHNDDPSMAVDAVPWPVNWEDMVEFEGFVRFVQGVALGKFNIRLRTGIDWDGNWKKDENFVDAPHFELHSKLIEGVWVKYEKF